VRNLTIVTDSARIIADYTEFADESIMNRTASVRLSLTGGIEQISIRMAE